MEIWVDIKGFEGIYQISNKGIVRSKDREITFFVKGIYPAKRIYTGKIITPYKNNKGYYMVDLQYKGKKVKKHIHRLIAEAFIPNPENKPCIDHINGDRTDNRIENLRWCTYKENNNNPITKERQKNKIVSEETRKKLSEGHKGLTPWNKGTPCTKVTKGKISDANSKQIFQYSLDNILIAVYKNSVIASEKTGLPQSQINRHAHGKYFSKQRNKWYYKNTYKGYKWSFEPL